MRFISFCDLWEVELLGGLAESASAIRSTAGQGLSQQQIADLAGCTQVYVSQTMKGLKR
jgi:predicted XRE-type DNA-binding protein